MSEGVRVVRHGQKDAGRKTTCQGGSGRDGKERYQCEFCSLTFSTPAILRRHMKSVHEGGGYVCQYCDKVFKRSDNLNTHQSVSPPAACKTRTSRPLQGRGAPAPSSSSATSDSPRVPVDLTLVTQVSVDGEPLPEEHTVVTRVQITAPRAPDEATGREGEDVEETRARLIREMQEAEGRLIKFNQEHPPPHPRS